MKSSRHGNNCVYCRIKKSDHFHLYNRVDSSANPCNNCPWNKKHHILRIVCSNRRLFSPAFKRALVNGLHSGKDVKSLVPSLGRIEGKGKFG